MWKQTGEKGGRFKHRRTFFFILSRRTHPQHKYTYTTTTACIWWDLFVYVCIFSIWAMLEFWLVDSVECGGKLASPIFFSFSDCIPFITKNTNTRTHAYIPLRTNTFTQVYTVRVVLHARMHLTIIIVCDGSFVPMLRHSSELKGDEYHHHFFLEISRLFNEAKWFEFYSHFWQNKINKQFLWLRLFANCVSLSIWSLEVSFPYSCCSNTDWA